MHLKTLKMKSIAIDFLIKLGKKEHMANLLKNGELYLNTYKYFREQDEKERKANIKSFIEVINLPDKYLSPCRRDNLEGLNQTLKGSLKFNLLGEYIFIKDAYLNFFQNKYSHLYCMYSIDNRLKNDFFFDKRNLAFGNSAIVIKNPKDFIDRVSKGLKNEGLNCDYKPVHYYDSLISSTKLTPFHKLSFYDFQKEFRIVTNTEASQPLNVKIGNIEDIAFILDSEKLLDMKLIFKDINDYI